MEFYDRFREMSAVAWKCVGFGATPLVNSDSFRSELNALLMALKFALDQKHRKELPIIGDSLRAL